MIKLAIIGTGAMGSAIATGLSSSGLYRSGDIGLFDLREDVLAALQSQYGFVTSNSLPKLVDALSDDGILLIAVKPQNIEDLLKDLSSLKPGIIVVSIAAGVKISKFEKSFPLNPVIRVMPNTPAQIAKGASVLAPNSKCSKHSIQQVQNILKSLGLAIVLDESKLDAVTALSGSGPAYVFYLIEAMTDSGVKLGLDLEASRALARQTVYGAACLVMESGEEASELRRKVTSPNGTTQAAIESFEQDDFKNIVNRALEAACKRSKELS